jgi:hypothetical protein
MALLSRAHDTSVPLANPFALVFRNAIGGVPMAVTVRRDRRHRREPRWEKVREKPFRSGTRFSRGQRPVNPLPISSSTLQHYNRIAHKPHLVGRPSQTIAEPLLAACVHPNRVSMGTGRNPPSPGPTQIGTIRLKESPVQQPVPLRGNAS